MSSDIQDGVNSSAKAANGGDTEDTIPLKNAENCSLAKDQSSSATIDITDQSTKEKRRKFIGEQDFSYYCCTEF